MTEKEFDLDKIMEVSDGHIDDILYSGRRHLHTKLMQFWSFLNSNPITKHALQALEKDNQDFVDQIDNYFKNDRFPLLKNNILYKLEESIINGGVFGYCFLKNVTITSERTQPEIEEIFGWEKVSNYDEAFESFENMVLNPFYRVFKWYIEERQTDNSEDYFSVSELQKLNNKIDDLKDEISSMYNYLNLGQEIIFEELEEIKEIAKSQKKKYVIRIIIGSLLSYVTSSDQFHILMGKLKDFLSSIGGKSISIIENM